MPFQRNQQKIKKSHLITLGLVAFFGIALRLWQFHYNTEHVILKNEKLYVQLAETPKQWYKGLGGRENMGEFDGMFFLFPFFEKHVFVMRDMKFSIDIVWFNAGKVVDIAPSVPVHPQDMQYTPRALANAVLELPAGWAEAHKLQIGDRLEPVKK